MGHFGPDFDEGDPILGVKRLTPESLAKLLQSDRRLYYKTPELNEKLFIHYGGYRKLEHLAQFPRLRCLYAECNALEDMTGLEELVELRSLFLQQNCIKQIGGLGPVIKLVTLNLSENFITAIHGLAHLPNLETLILAKNRIGVNGLEDVIELAMTAVQCLDLQSNKVSCVELHEEVLLKMRNLKVLYLKGNEVCKNLKNYRKKVINDLPELSYLDDRPVFVEDRRYAMAFMRGGIEAEREERRVVKKEKDEEQARNMRYFRQMTAEAREMGREKRAMLAEDRYDALTDPTKWGDANRARKKQHDDDMRELEEERRNAPKILVGGKAQIQSEAKFAPPPRTEIKEARQEAKDRVDHLLLDAHNKIERKKASGVCLAVANESACDGPSHGCPANELDEMD